MSIPNNENWVVFPMDEDEPSLVMTNMALADDAPDAERPIAMCLRIPFEDPGEFGIGADDEYDAICAIEDALAERIHREHDGVRAGRIRMEGQLDVWFYLRPDTAEAIAEFVSEAMDGREHDVGAGEDPDWTVYNEQLLPDDQQMQWILDQQLVTAFEDMGDDLTVERPITFVACFRNKASAQAFQHDARAAGFAPDAIEESDDAEAPFTATVTRTAAIDFDSVHPLTLQLLDLTERHGGGFDGWEAQPASAING